VLSALVCVLCIDITAQVSSFLNTAQDTTVNRPWRHFQSETEALPVSHEARVVADLLQNCQGDQR